MSKLPVFKTIKEAMDYGNIHDIIDNSMLLERVLPVNAKNELVNSVRNILDMSSLKENDKRKFVNKVKVAVDNNLKGVKKPEVRLNKMNQLVKKYTSEASMLRQLNPRNLPRNKYYVSKQTLYLTCSDLVKKLKDHTDEEKEELIFKLQDNIYSYMSTRIPIDEANNLIKDICNISLLDRGDEIKLVAFAYTKKNKEDMKEMLRSVKEDRLPPVIVDEFAMTHTAKLSEVVRDTDKSGIITVGDN